MLPVCRIFQFIFIYYALYKCLIYVDNVADFLALLGEAVNVVQTVGDFFREMLSIKFVFPEICNHGTDNYFDGLTGRSRAVQCSGVQCSAVKFS